MYQNYTISLRVFYIFNKIEWIHTHLTILKTVPTGIVRKQSTRITRTLAEVLLDYKHFVYVKKSFENSAIIIIIKYNAPRTETIEYIFIYRQRM